MSVRALVGLLAAFTFVLFSAEARADCDPGYYSCGASYCAPSGTVCCASVGHPEMHCKAGYTCNSDGTCSSGSSGGDCGAGKVVCGSGCMPSGASCCDYLGYNGYCDPGESCTNDGKCSTGSSGGSCPAGYPIDCGDNTCCPSGTTCVAEGCRSPGGGTSPGGSSGGSSGDAYCSESYPQGNCTSVRSCVDASSERAWYTADGNTFQCSSAYNCNDAAWDLAEYCTNSGGSYDGSSDDEDDRSGCSVARPAAPGPSGGGGPLALVTAAAGLALALRSRRR